MNTLGTVTPQSTVLVVDDDAVSRMMLSFYLSKSGQHPVAADSASAARKLIGEIGPSAVDCVVTDYNMPGESGLELLLWLKQADPTLSVVMITATTERETVTSTLRSGASDFLDKPISPDKLKEAVKSGIALTAQRRRLAESDRAVCQVRETQGQIFGLGAQSASHLLVCYHPCHAAGGDFVNFFQSSPSQFHVIAADVSGHDLNAAFVSAYFQGMTRGMIESGQSIPKIFQRFNEILLEEWSRGGEGGPAKVPHSLCACMVSVDMEQRRLSLYNHGIPQTWQISLNGQISPSKCAISAPLGWFDELNNEMAQVDFAEVGQVLVWSDGLEDLADDFEVSPLSVAARLLRAQIGEQSLPELAMAKDDVLVVRVRVPSDASAPAWLPVLHKVYHGGQCPEIDLIHEYWERCFQMAMPELSEARLFDVLLSTRESVLNAMKHGCGSRADQMCQLMISADTQKRLIRVQTSDSGPGHEFDCSPRHTEAEPFDLHRGLAIIQRLATQMIRARNGAELTLDFSY